MCCNFSIADFWKCENGLVGVDCLFLYNFEHLVRMFVWTDRKLILECFFTPPPLGERGIVFGRFLSFFVSFCFFVSLSASLRENGWTDLHEIFREGVE